MIIVIIAVFALGYLAGSSREHRRLGRTMRRYLK